MISCETDNRLHKEDLKKILDTIPDIIEVYNPDHTVKFINEAGRKIINKTFDDIYGHKCYEIFNKNQKCINCICEQVVIEKKTLHEEKYIPELEKLMDIYYNPVFDENGDVDFIVRRLTDITDKKILEESLVKDNEKYKHIINDLPDALLIVEDNKIVQVNNLMCKFLGLQYDQIINKNIFQYSAPQYVKPLKRKMKNVLRNKKKRDIFECHYRKQNGELIFLQLVTGYLEYGGKPALFILIRDNTEVKMELNKAALFQKSSLQTEFNGDKHLDVKTIYYPASTISGDFYRLWKVDEEHILGVVIDVRGKGVSAALNISAVEILFLQEVEKKNTEPILIAQNLNKFLEKYYDDTYIAVCIFSMDFNKNQLKAVGAGINRFFYKPSDGEVKEEIIRGPFLGMFEDSEFEEKIINFKSNDSFFFFTDGLDFILEDNPFIEKSMSKESIEKVVSNVKKSIQNELMDNERLKDDCTMLAINVK